MWSISFLKSSSEFWEWVEYAGEVLVAIGVILEYRAECIADRKSTTTGMIGLSGEEFVGLGKTDDDKRRKSIKLATLTLISGLFVALAGIVRTNQLSDERIARLNRATELARQAGAEANERAAIANESAERERLARVQLESRLSGRHLSIQQANAIVEKAKPYAGQTVDIFVFENSAESISLAQQLRSILGIAKWDVREWYVVPGGHMPDGVKVSVLQGSPATTFFAASALISAFPLDVKTLWSGTHGRGELKDEFMPIDVRPMDSMFGNMFPMRWEDQRIQRRTAEIRISVGAQNPFPPNWADEAELLARYVREVAVPLMNRAKERLDSEQKRVDRDKKRR